MPASDQSIVIGVFDDPASANRSLIALQEAGFRKDQIRGTIDERHETGTRGAKGLSSGESATTRGNLVNDLVGMGVDPHDARIYQKEYEEGHPLVSVTGTGNMQKAINILHEQGARAPAELEQREAGGRASGRSAGVAGTTPGPGTAGTRRPATSRERGRNADASRTSTGPRAEEYAEASSPEAQKLRLHAERLKAYKQPEQIGEVDIHKEIVSEQQTLNVPVSHEEIVIERRSLAEDAAAAEGPIGEDETIRIPLQGERVNVTKETVPTEEVDISKSTVREDRQFSDTVRHEEAHLENKGDIPIINTEQDQPPSQPQV